MKEDREQTKLDFLEYAVTHLENRIGLLDKIASILIAIQTGFFVLVAFVLKYVLGGDTLYFQVVGYTFLLGLVLITALVIILLIWTIRPTKNVLGLKTHVDRLNEDENVMWFSDKFPQSAEHYKERVVRQQNGRSHNFPECLVIPARRPSQGYLVAGSKALYAPGGKGYPVVYDRNTGDALGYIKAGSRDGGSWALLSPAYCLCYKRELPDR